MPDDQEDLAWQRLDKFLFIARFCRSRAAAIALIAKGSVRINRMPTDKPHAKLRAGDVLTLPLPAGVVVARVVALAPRRAGATQARLLYQHLD